jgi:lysozyme family protein
MEVNRHKSISLTEAEEGAYPNGWNPHDPSYCGITLEEWNRMRAQVGKPPATLVELEHIEPSQIDEFYDWKCNRIGFDELEAGLDYAALDASINEGEAGMSALLIITEPLKADVASRIDAMSDIRLAVKKRRPAWTKSGTGWQARIGDRVPTQAKAMMEPSAAIGHGGPVDDGDV